MSRAADVLLARMRALGWKLEARRGDECLRLVMRCEAAEVVLLVDRGRAWVWSATGKPALIAGWLRAADEAVGG